MSGPVQYVVAFVLDSAGVPFSPESCSHVYGYTGTDMTTDTATDQQGVVRVKHYTYAADVAQTETMWVRQE